MKAPDASSAPRLPPRPQLCWNESDDPNSVASGFIQAHSLAVDNFEEARAEAR